MLELVRFSTNDPAKLTSELDRFVLAVRRELADSARTSAERFTPRAVTNGVAGTTQTVTAKLGELVPVNPALGPVDVYLPPARTADAGRSLLVTVQSSANLARLQPGTVLLNMSAATLALATVAAYLVVWDGAAWWTVHNAP